MVESVSCGREILKGGGGGGGGGRERELPTVALSVELTLFANWLMSSTLTSDEND